MNDLYAEAIRTFSDLLDAARASAEPEPTAMTLASADLHGRPSARTVLLKAVEERGFVFYTNLGSHKSRELRENPQAALLFLWKLLDPPTQVRIEGRVEAVDDAEADAYFATRDRVSQIGAWASKQSETLESRAAFEQRMADVEHRYQDRPVPRPPFWSGLRVVPDAFEFWYGAKFRLHERQCYELRDGEWSKRMLYP